MKKIILTLFLIIISISGYSQSVEIDNRLLIDIDNTIVDEHQIKYFQHINNGKIGIGVGRLNIKDVNYSSYDMISAGLNYKAGSNLIEANVDYLPEYKVMYDAVYRASLLKLVTVELYSSINPIGTSETADRGLTSMTNGGSLDLNITESKLTIVGGYYFQSIETLNSNLYRNIYIGKIINQFGNGMGIEFNNKIIRSDKTTSLFFSPNKFDKHLLGVYYPLVIFNDNAVIKPSISYGLQRIHSEYDNIYQIGIGYKGWFTDKFGFQGDVEYSNSYNEWGRYSYMNGNIKLIYRFI